MKISQIFPSWVKQPLGYKSPKISSEINKQSNLVYVDYLLPHKAKSLAYGYMLSPSYDMQTISIFNSAKTQLENLAAHHQGKKPAICVDIDETLVKNISYLRDNKNVTNWDPWLQAGTAPEIEGAKSYIEKAVELDVSVFYVTNRPDEFKDSAMKNLIMLGFPGVDAEHLLCKTDARSKRARREHILAEHDIIQLVGDSPHDFHEDYDDLTGEALRDRILADRHKWGRKYISLPNCAYGEFVKPNLTELKSAESEKRAASHRQLCRIWSI